MRNRKILQSLRPEGAGMGAGLESAKASGIAAFLPKSGFLPKMAFRLRFQIETSCFEEVLGRLSKPENVAAREAGSSAG